MCRAKAHEFLYSAASKRDCVRELHCLAPDGRPALSLVVSEEYFKSKFNEQRRTTACHNGGCGTICNDVQCPNAVGGSRHIHRNHVQCRPACHGRRTRMRHSVPLRVRSLHLHRQAVQPQLVSAAAVQPLLSRGRPWLSGSTCSSPCRRRHGRSWWRGGAGAGRTTPATR